MDSYYNTYNLKINAVEDKYIYIEQKYKINKIEVGKIRTTIGNYVYPTTSLKKIGYVAYRMFNGLKEMFGRALEKAFGDSYCPNFFHSDWEQEVLFLEITQFHKRGKEASLREESIEPRKIKSAIRNDLEEILQLENEIARIQHFIHKNYVEVHGNGSAPINRLV